MNAQRVGRLVRAKRKRRRLSQPQLARIAQVSQASLSRLETGLSIPRAAALLRICHALEIDISGMG